MHENPAKSEGAGSVFADLLSVYDDGIPVAAAEHFQATCTRRVRKKIRVTVANVKCLGERRIIFRLVQMTRSIVMMMK